MEQIQTKQESEVKEEPKLEEQKPAEAEQVDAKQEQVAENSQPPEQEPKTETNATLLELEEVLKGLEPNEVLKFQREISAELGQNLFEGEVGELFKKYKPSLTREQQVKNVANLLRGDNKTRETAKPPKRVEVDNKEQELLTAKIKLELYRKGVVDEFLEDATTIALTKIKSEAELDKCGEIATRYAKISKPQAPRQETQATIPVGEKDRDMTEGEKAVAFLKKLNPKGYK